MLTFQEAGHRYEWDGKPVPHVTGILSPINDYSMVNAEQLEIARQKGIAVHRMVELWAKNDLDEAGLPDWMRPAHAWWLKFVAESGIEIVASEQKVFHTLYQFAGTLDIKARIRGRKGVGIIDVKRSFFGGRSIGLQTAAYREADATSCPKDDRATWRAALRLREDAPYRLINDQDDKDIFAKDDFNVFLALLTIKRWKEKQ